MTRDQKAISNRSPVGSKAIEPREWVADPAAASTRDPQLFGKHVDNVCAGLRLPYCSVQKVLRSS